MVRTSLHLSSLGQASTFDPGACGMSVIHTFNVESGLPTLDEARRLVIDEIKRAKDAGARVLKVIHGLRFIRQGWSALRWAEEVVAIRDFIAGEDFTIFNDTVLALLEAVPELRGDPDLGATNEGVTIVWLK